MKDDLFIFTNKYTMRVLIGGNMQKIPVDLPDTLWGLFSTRIFPPAHTQKK